MQDVRFPFMEDFCYFGSRVLMQIQQSDLAQLPGGVFLVEFHQQKIDQIIELGLGLMAVEFG
jgi:hypothetical protein